MTNVRHMKTFKNIYFNLSVIIILTGCSDSRKTYSDIDLEQDQRIEAGGKIS